MYSFKILSNWSKDLFHSSIITFEKKSYLFNCSDGTQRNLSHQNIKFNKINHIFFNSASIDAYLGSYGFSMSRNETLGSVFAKIEENPDNNSLISNEEDKKSENENLNNKKNNKKDYKIKDNLIPLMEESSKPLYFWGPQPLRNNFDFCKYFFVERVKDYIYEFNPIKNRFELKFFSKEENNNNKKNPEKILLENPKQNNEPDLFAEYFEDENLKIFPIISTIKDQNNNLKYDTAMSYFCEPHLKQRTFLPQKAKSLGLKPGPNYSILQSGKSVFLPDGKEIKPEDVLGDQMPSSCFAILYSPNIEHSKNLIEYLKTKNFFQENENKKISLIVHILGDQEILKNKEYKDFIKDISAIHKDVLHIIDCKETNYKFMLNEEKHKIKYLLNKGDEKLYQQGFFDEQETLPNYNLNEFFLNDLEIKNNIINSNCGFEYILYPIHKKGIFQNKIYEPFIFDKKNKNFLNFVKNVDELIEVHKLSENWNYQKKNDKVENDIDKNSDNLKIQVESDFKNEKTCKNFLIKFRFSKRARNYVFRNILYEARSFQKC